jgi:hypothetical protein
MGSVVIGNRFVARDRIENLQDSSRIRDGYLVKARGEFLIDNMVAQVRKLQGLGDG